MPALGPPTTTIGVITSVDAINGVYGLAYGGRIFEAADPSAVAPVVGDHVLADYLPSSSQWILVAIIT